MLVYTASNYGVFPHCWAQDPRRDTLVFARHESGPAYFGYEYLGVQAGLKVLRTARCSPAALRVNRPATLTFGVWLRGESCWGDWQCVDVLPSEAYSTTGLRR